MADYLDPPEWWEDEHGFVGPCGACDHFKECPFEGCEGIGWCAKYGEFTKADDGC